MTLLSCAATDLEPQGPNEAPDEAPARDDQDVDLRSDDTIPATATLPRAADAAVKPRVPSVTAVSGFEKIFQKPDTKAPLIGLFRAGQSVPLAGTEPLKGPGVGHCKGGFYAVKPRGYVCVGQSSTLADDDPRALAAAEVVPDPKKKMPFLVGTMVKAAPQYKRIPTRDEQRKSEADLDKHLASLDDFAKKEGIDLTKAGRGPSPRIAKYIEVARPALLADDDAYVGRKMAFTGEFDADGRTFLVTPDLTFVPKDKVKLQAPSKLSGIDLRKGDMQLPVGYAWIEDAAKLKRTQDNKFVETGEVWPKQSFIQLKGELIRVRGQNYWETSEGTYVRNDLVTIFKERGEGRPVGVGKNDKWIDVRITWGTLVAYEGDKPVFITAVSPGQDGVTQGSNSHNTQRGTYSIGWKLITADMAGVDKAKAWAVDEVPFVAYYKDSFALHGAWWHDDFGRPKSHGCVNLAPADANFIWSWLEPGLPDGWYAAAAYYPEIRGTTVRIRP